MGSPSDFTFQLPQAVSMDNTLGIVLSQLSTPNAFNTVMANFNDMLYFALDLQDQLGLVTNLNNRIYVLTRSADRVFAGTILTITPGHLQHQTAVRRGGPERLSRRLAGLVHRGAG